MKNFKGHEYFCTVGAAKQSMSFSSKRTSPQFNFTFPSFIRCNLHSAHNLFQFSCRPWPPLNPTLFSLRVCVSRKPLCCVWAAKHCSEQWLPGKCDCYFNSESAKAACGLSVCSVCASALKFPPSGCRGRKRFRRRRKSDSQGCQSLSAGSAWLQFATREDSGVV